MKSCGEDGSSYRWDRPIILDCRLFHELRLKYVEKWKMKSSVEEIKSATKVLKIPQVSFVLN